MQMSEAVSDGNESDGNESDRKNPIETIGQAYEWPRTRALPRGVAFLTEGGMNTETNYSYE